MAFNSKPKLNNTALICIVLLIWNTIYMIEAVSMGSPVKKGQVDINFFPVIISVFMYIATIYLLLNSFKIKQETFQLNIPSISKPVLIIIFTFIYIILLRLIGYMFSSIIYIFSILLIFSSGNRKVLTKIIYSIIIAMLIFLLYEKIFAIRLPKIGIGGIF